VYVEIYFCLLFFVHYMACVFFALCQVGYINPVLVDILIVVVVGGMDMETMCGVE